MLLLAQYLDSPYSAYAINTVGALVLLVIGWLVAGWSGKLVHNACAKANIDLTLSKFFAKLARWAILALVVLSCLGLFGISTASFAAVLAAVGFAVGLAWQGTLSNFAAGVMLLIFRPFKVGDFISVAGTSGTVDEIELFTTSLDTPDNRRLILPNSSVFGATIENVTFHPKRRVDIAVGVAYSADIDHTRSTLTQAASQVPNQIPDSQPEIFLSQLGASSVDWQVRIWCKTQDYWTAREALIRAVKMALDSAGIEIPFPQMNVHLRQQPPQGAGPAAS